MEQLAAGVVEVVQCDQDVAMRALQFTGGDMQDAIALLLENNGEVPDMDDLGDYSQEEEDAAQLLDGGQAEFDNDDDSGSGLEDELDAMAEASAANEDRSALAGAGGFQFTLPAEMIALRPSTASPQGFASDSSTTGLTPATMPDAPTRGDDPALNLGSPSYSPTSPTYTPSSSPPAAGRFGAPAGGGRFGARASDLSEILAASQRSATLSTPAGTPNPFANSLGGSGSPPVPGFGAGGSASRGAFGASSSGSFGSGLFGKPLKYEPPSAKAPVKKRTGQKVDPAEAARVRAEVRAVLRAEEIQTPETKNSGGQSTNSFFLCGDGLTIGQSGLTVDREGAEVACDRCWAVTSKIKQYAEIVIVRVGEKLPRQEDTESRERERSVEAMLSYHEFGDHRRRRVSNTTRIGVTTDVGTLDPGSAFPEHHGGSAERSTYIWEGRHLKRNGEMVGQSLPEALDSLKVGDRIGVCVESNTISFYVNGVQQGSSESLQSRCNGKELHLVVDLRGTAVTICSTSASQPMTQVQLDSGTLMGLVKGDNKAAAAAIEESIQKSDKAELSEPDTVGRLPLHYMCANSTSTPSLLRALASAYPEALLVADMHGCTPTTYLFTGLPKDSSRTDKSASSTAMPREAAMFWRPPGSSEQHSTGEPRLVREEFPEHLVEPRNVTVEHLAALFEVNEDILWCKGKAGEIPIVTAERAGADTTVTDWLTQQYRAAGRTWFGGAEHSQTREDSDQCGIHVLLHVNTERSEGDVLPTHEYQWDLTATLRELAKGNSSFLNKTKIHGLPFTPAAVQQVCTTDSNCAFLLKTGAVWRLNISILANGDTATAMSVNTEQQQYDEAKVKLRQAKDQLKGFENALKKAESASHKYDESQVEQLVDMLQLPRDDVVRVLRRLTTSSSRKITLASNILMGIEPDDNQPYYDGDPVGKAKYEISTAEDNVRSLEEQVKNLEPAKDINVKVDAATLLHTGDLERWDGPTETFCKLAITQSELLALDSNGSLYRWRHDSPSGSQEIHPRAQELCHGEAISAIESAGLRTSVLTRSGKVATWLDDVCFQDGTTLKPAEAASALRSAQAVSEMDDANSAVQLQPLVKLLEHSAGGIEFESAVKQIAVTDYGTAAVTENGCVYWWGGRPGPIRKSRFMAMQQNYSSSFVRSFHSFVDSFAKSSQENYVASGNDHAAWHAGMGVEMRGGGSGRDHGGFDYGGLDRGHRDRSGSRGGGAGKGRGGHRGGRNWPGGRAPHGYGVQSRHGPGAYRPSDLPPFAAMPTDSDAIHPHLSKRPDQINTPSLKEVMALIGDDSYYRSHLKRLGPTQAKSFACLQKAFAENIRSLKIGGDVLLVDHTSLLKYKAGSRVLLSHGKIITGRLKEDINDMSDPKRIVSILTADGIERDRIEDIIFLDAESRWTEARLLKIDQERGVALVREVGKSAEDISIVNLMQITPKTDVHCMCDAVLEKPIRVFEPRQLLSDENGHIGISFNKAYESYCASSRDGTVLDRQNLISLLTRGSLDQLRERGLTEDQVELFRNVVCRPDITDIQGSGWRLNMSLRSATKTEILYRWEADLSTGNWKLSPSRWVSGEIGNSRVCMATTTTTMVTDSQSYLCDPPVPGLPKVACSTGTKVALPYMLPRPMSESKRWERLADGQWLPFSKSESARIDEARNSGQDTCHVGEYLVHLGPMIAQDLHDNHISVRRTSRASERGSIPATSLFVVGFSPDTVAKDRKPDVGCMGRTALHDAIFDSPGAVTALLAQLTPVEFEQMATQRDNMGATAFFAAMKCADLGSALAILSRSLKFADRACHPPDIFGCPPIHALFGLSNVESDVVRCKECDDGVLCNLFQELSKDTAIVGARDTAGNTAIDALILATSQAGSTVPCWSALLQRFIAAPINGVGIFVAEADDNKLDTFTGCLASCWEHQPFAKDLPKWIGEWALRVHERGVSMKLYAKKMMQSLVRVFCALFSAQNVMIADQQADVYSHPQAATFYMKIFRTVPSLAMEVLAKTANDVIELVRLGLPLRPLPVGGIDPTSTGRTTKISKGIDAGEISSIYSAAASKVHEHSKNTMEGAIPFRPRAAKGFANDLTHGLPITEGATVQLRDGLRASQTLRVPSGSTGTVTAVDRDHGMATVEFVNSDANNRSSGAQSFEDDTEEDDEEEDDDDVDFAQLLARDARLSGVRIDRQRARKATTTWRGKIVDLVFAGASETAAAAASDPKTQRAQIFHLCVCTIAKLYDERSAERYAAMPEFPLLDSALVAAARILQPSWEHVFDCCDITEAGLQASAAQSADTRQMPVTQYMHAAYGIGCGVPDAAQVAYVAVMLDAVVWLKEMMPANMKKYASPDDDKEELSFVLSAGPPVNSSGEELVRGVSFAYQHGQDIWSQEKRKLLLKGAFDIDVDTSMPKEYDGRRITRVLQRDLLSFPTLRALHRWQKTICFFGSSFDRRGSLFRLLEPFEKKAARFRSRMEDIVRHCDSDKSVKLDVSRDSCAGDVCDILRATRLAHKGEDPSLGRLKTRATQELPPLCQLIHSKSKFKDEMGEGKGLIRSIMNVFATDFKSGKGVVAGLLRPAPTVQIPPTGLAWNNLEGCDRDAALALGFSEQTWPEWAGHEWPDWNSLDPQQKAAAAKLECDERVDATGSTSQNGLDDACEVTTKRWPPKARFWWEETPFSRVVPAAIHMSDIAQPESEDDTEVEAEPELVSEPDSQTASDPCSSPAINDEGSTADELRLDRLRGLGNVIGLCLLHGGSALELRLPLYFSRHVYKFLLARRVTFADYAYFNEPLYKQLAKAMREGMVGWGFQWDREVGWQGEEKDIKESDGESPDGYKAWIQAKWTWDMVVSVKAELESLREGLHDVIPPEELSDLTADDLQMLLSGCGDFISLADFQRATKFEDGRTSEVMASAPGRLAAFEPVFWGALKLMSASELLKLANFATDTQTHLSKLTVRLVDPEPSGLQPISAHTCNYVLDIADKEGMDEEDLKYCLLESIFAGEIIGYNVV